MNKWQKVYCDTYHNGKLPRSKRGKADMAILGQIKAQVIVNYPDFKGMHGFEPAHTEIYTVTETDCDMPNGKISVCVLANNLSLWLSRGYKVSTR